MPATRGQRSGQAGRRHAAVRARPRSCSGSETDPSSLLPCRPRRRGRSRLVRDPGVRRWTVDRLCVTTVEVNAVVAATASAHLTSSGYDGVHTMGRMVCRLPGQGPACRGGRDRRHVARADVPADGGRSFRRIQARSSMLSKASRCRPHLSHRSPVVGCGGPVPADGAFGSADSGGDVGGVQGWLAPVPVGDRRRRIGRHGLVYVRIVPADLT